MVHDSVDTNILFFDVADAGMTAGAFNEALRRRGVRMSTSYAAGSRVRAVTHLDVCREDCERAVAAAGEVLAGA